MKISVVIPTYNRSEELKSAVESVLDQSTPANEIIVVDNGNDSKTEDILQFYSNNKSNTQIRYLKNHVNSVSVARNIGGQNAQGDIIFFLDDDDKFDTYYIEEIIQIYSDCPNALIVQGNLAKEISKSNIIILWNNIWNLYSKFFYIFSFSKNMKKVLPSGKNVSPSYCDKVINCQWASGGCSSVKKKVFNEFLYDNNLIKYSYGEDVDFSYRIYKKYPQSIYLAPKAKLLYKGSFNKGTPLKQAIIMEKAYNLYFVSKNLGKPINYILFFWSEIGMFLQDMLFCVLFIKKRGKYFLLRLLYSLCAYYICIRFFSRIQNLDIDYINNRYLL
ncbi:glycosyltransferase family 2 protein [Methanosarcina sp. WWM596]|uniref:glycosyltransferase family 2 protein n=1 Tax=Methanosarcina sp. WWM596 TaxID=1434103 RepID=UPI0006155D8C|nr:glycosyltransferase [Methanosarcina sp. WWM596]AKB17616.1 Glycosyltransferase involved in cell wall biogenesis [Methanosarcina sp. WWM596]